MPFVVGLTGGIGSGKSTVASYFHEYGATVIDADVIARELTEPNSPVLSELQKAFGNDILDDHGNLIRLLLAERAFSSAERTLVLNKIMHGRIRERALTLINAHSPSDIVVYDMPLLAETNSADLCNFVVVVQSPETQRIDRLMQSRGMSLEDIKHRIEQQASDTERAAIADVIIHNDSSQEELALQCEQVWNLIVEQAGNP